jgi:hypothetical protein
MRSPRRVFAVDWSGDARAAYRKIWLCEVADGNVIRLERGRSPESLVDHLIEEAARDPSLAVGLDFAFSFPCAFLHKRGHRTVESVWQEARLLGERWLERCPFPFWGKPGSTKPSLRDELLRRTDRAVAAESRLAPKSIFQIGGPGAVGVASIRGMPRLLDLRRAGFSIWPFDAPGLPVALEIWPRLFMGSIVKSRRNDRVRFLAERFPDLPAAIGSLAKRSDDAFDALAAALAMDRHREQLTRPSTDDPVTRLEGEIWRPWSATRVLQPGCRRARGSARPRCYQEETD